MFGRTTLKPRASLCKLFFIFLFFIYYHLHQNFCYQKIFYGRQIFLNGEYGRKSVGLIEGLSMEGIYSVGLIEPK